MKPDREGLEILDKLIKDGIVWLDGSEYVGKASDGTEVNLGNTTSMKHITNYLKLHPTPDTW